MKKLKNEILNQIKEELKPSRKKPSKKQEHRPAEDRFFALDLETEIWSKEKPDLTQIKPIFGVLTEFDPTSFNIERELVFKACEIKETLESLVNLHSKNTLFVYVHNLDFDFMFLLKPFLKLPEKFRIYPVIVGSRIIKVSIMKVCKNKEETQYRTLVEFRNTYCLISKSLKKIGQEIGVLKMDNDFSTMNESGFTDKDIEYCKQDNRVVVALLETWSKTMTSLGLNLSLEKITLTAASSAFKLFKSKHSAEKIDENGKLIKYCPWILDSVEMNKEYRNFYYGGRTEVFSFEFAEGVAYYDINSLYPFIMTNLQMQKPPYFKIEGFNEQGFAFEAFVDETKEEIPIFAERLDGKVCFTAKKKKVFLFREELEYVRSQRIPYEIVSTWLSLQDWEKPFEYIAELYSLRKRLENEGQKGLSGAVKIIMNSTYGRFALQTERESLKIEEFRKENITEYSDIFSDVGVIKETEEISAEINVVMACKITALARLEITKKAREITKNGYKIYYMDTDSLVVSHGSIEESKDLGGFKIEHNFDWFQGISAKDYTGQEKDNQMFKTKGSRVNNMTEFVEYHRNGLLNVRPTKLKEMIALARQGKIQDLEPVQRNVIKRYMSVYDKRYINEDLSTRPINEKDTIEDIKINNAKQIVKVFEKIMKKVD